MESEISKLEVQASEIERNPNMSLQPLKVSQSVKCIVNLMGDLCTLDIMQSVDALNESCRQFSSSSVSYYFDLFELEYI